MNERGRVPFALVGVLLLVGSAAVAPSLTTAPDLGEPDVDVAMERFTAQAVSAIEEGVERGARAAARNPVITPANTTFGRVLDDDRPFRDALKVRIYTAVREALAETSVPRRGLALEASLPDTETPGELERAVGRVSLSRAGPNGTALRASIGNVTLVARAEGTVVGRTEIDPSVTVQVPILAVHERVSTFEERLDAGPLDPGLGRRLTAKLYPVTWARGYAQYGGLPIQNVVANRHLSLLANGGVLDEQRRVFGRSDPVGRQVHGLATLEAAIVDVLAVEAPDTLGTLQRVRRIVDLGKPDRGEAFTALTGDAPTPQPNSRITVGVNATATRAYADLLTRFNDTIDRTFTADTRVRARRVETTGTRPAWPEPPEKDCTVLGRNRTRSVTVTNRSTSFEEAPGEWHLFRGVARTVEMTRTKRLSWLCGGEPARRSDTETQTVAVNLRLEGAHQNGAAPKRPVRTVHEPAGPFDGPNLADVRDRAIARLLPDQGTIDHLAERAAVGDEVRRNAEIQGAWSPRLYPWIYDEVATLRERVRNYSVDPTRGMVATMQATPARTLLKHVENDTSLLVRVPVEYNNVSHRALVSLKWEYIERVKRRLERRADRRAANRDSLRTQLADRQNASLETMQESFRHRNEWRTPDGPELQMEVNAAPSYLTSRQVSRDDVPALRPGESYHPMVARNLNVFTLPYGAIANTISSVLFGPKHARLSTGAQLLESAARLGEVNDSVTAAPEVKSLRNEVQLSLRYIGNRYATWMAGTDIGTQIGWRRVYTDAIETFDTPRTRARAVTSGRIVPLLLRAASERWPEQVDRPTWRDRLGVRSNYSLDTILEQSAAGPTAPAANRTRDPIRNTVQSEVQARLGDVMENATMAAIQQATNRTWSRLPSGLPIAPAPGLWYTTVNLWHTQVRGEYARFAVTVPQGTPANPGGSVAYIRDGTAAEIDVDGDGDPDRLGTASRVSFGTETLVAIAVPPGSAGVGDVDGTRNETSPGWPWPSDRPPDSK
jgi:hypothetical protein